MKPPLSNLPQHIAIIMDGNGRWAKKRFLPRYAGHKAGTESVRQAVQVCAELGIEALTLFAFSSENWRRPAREVDMLMDLFLNALQREANRLHKNNVQLQIIGERSAFPQKLQDKIFQVEQYTQANSGLKLRVAANYGGRWDILSACQQLAIQVHQGQLEPEHITQKMFADSLSLTDLPEPDLFIRTGGEHRISNFLLWQLAYTELYFTDVLWPDFNRDCLQTALNDFASRQRRFGQTGEQVEQQPSC